LSAKQQIDNKKRPLNTQDKDGRSHYHEQNDHNDENNDYFNVMNQRNQSNHCKKKKIVDCILDKTVQRGNVDQQGRDLEHDGHSRLSFPAAMSRHDQQVYNTSPYWQPQDPAAGPRSAHQRVLSSLEDALTQHSLVHIGQINIYDC
jgi:hypothetical protein